MKKNHQKNTMVIASVLLASLIVFGFAGTVHAGMLPINLGQELTNEELSSVRAQTGIALTTQGFNWEGQTDVLAWGDEDGCGTGEKGTGAWLSLNNVIYKGRADFGESLSVQMTTETLPNGMTEVTGLEMDFDHADIFIERFEVGSITLGPDPGQGKSLGSLVIGGMGIKIDGSVKFSAH
ncbi:MAG: hypothetical protein KKA60_01575 [Proteobacteria bacterium]|nr:hypothetical protein [Pseudomonadota bacterium]